MNNHVQNIPQESPKAQASTVKLVLAESELRRPGTSRPVLDTALSILAALVLCAAILGAAAIALHEAKEKAECPSGFGYEGAWGPEDCMFTALD